MIECNQISHSFFQGSEEIPILKNINYQFEMGTTYSIMGSSGSGKSTLLNILAGLMAPKEGKILVNQKDLYAQSDELRAQWRLQHTGYIYQDFRLLPKLTALENVAFVLQLMGQKISEAEAYAHKLLADMGLGERWKHYPAQLSGGEQQRVALCRAFANTKQVIFADEPTGNLDRKSADKVIEALLMLNQKYQTTLIMVTHEQSLAALAKHKLFLSEGQLL